MNKNTGFVFYISRKYLEMYSVADSANFYLYVLTTDNFDF